MLLPRQLARLDPATNKRTVRRAGSYHLESGDGDLHFCLGSEPKRPHIGCELQNANAWIGAFKKFIGQPITVTGFFRCLFEHPGFRTNDDAHIFEIHPVRAVTLGGKVYPFDVDVPDQDAIHTWTTPYALNKQDERVRIRYDRARDTLMFEDMDGRDENYVQVSGTRTDVRLASGSSLASFTFTSPQIGHSLKAYCLPGTSAAKQLARLKSRTIRMVALRNIDLREARKGHYVINPNPKITER